LTSRSVSGWPCAADGLPTQREPAGLVRPRADGLGVHHDLTAARAHPEAPRGLERHRVIARQGIHEDQPPLGERLERRPHADAILGHARAHVVGRADRRGQRGEMPDHAPAELGHRHRHHERARPGIHLGVAVGLHGQVEQHLEPHAGGL
jgi:hypothetical protein